MNASLASRLDLDDFTAPLDLGPAPTPGAAFDPDEQPLSDTRMPSASLWLPGRVLGYRYRIDRVVEAGGMAIVYEATQLDLMRRVAIKVPTAECAADSPCAQRFEQEARTLAELQHPHIVSVYELGRAEEGLAFIAMELVEGPTLRAHLMAERTLPWRVAAGFAAQLADALTVVHASGVVHGDVSATNVMLSRRGDIFVPKLIDFGAARRIDDPPHVTYGTQRYVAPELFDGKTPHILSDLYALGAVLKEMLGEAKLAASPQSLQQLVASMLDADPRGRPQSAAEVARRLRHALDSQSATASRLRPRWMAAGVVAVATLCALALYFLDRTNFAVEPRISVAAAPEFAPARTGATAALKGARVVPPEPPQPVRARLVAPVAIPVPQRELVAEPEAEPEAEAVTVTEVVSAPAEDPSDTELLGEDSVDRMEIVASLDRWFYARNQIADGEREALMAMRVGEPSIVFDPSGTSASVTYRKRLVYSRSSSMEQSIIEEREFFTKQGETWQIVNPDSG